jgi:hypothetical protein
MLPIPSHLSDRVDKYLQDQKTPDNLQWAYKKWLSYYLDFCDRYKHPPGLNDSLPGFMKKLKEKMQSTQQ